MSRFYCWLAPSITECDILSFLLTTSASLIFNTFAYSKHYCFNDYFLEYCFHLAFSPRLHWAPTPKAESSAHFSKSPIFTFFVLLFHQTLFTPLEYFIHSPMRYAIISTRNWCNSRPPNWPVWLYPALCSVDKVRKAGPDAYHWAPEYEGVPEWGLLRAG